MGILNSGFTEYTFANPVATKRDYVHKVRALHINDVQTSLNEICNYLRATGSLSEVLWSSATSPYFTNKLSVQSAIQELCTTLSSLGINDISFTENADGYILSGGSTSERDFILEGGDFEISLAGTTPKLTIGGTNIIELFFAKDLTVQGNFDTTLESYVQDNTITLYNSLQIGEASGTYSGQINFNNNSWKMIIENDCYIDQDLRTISTSPRFNRLALNQSVGSDGKLEIKIADNDNISGIYISNEDVTQPSTSIEIAHSGIGNGITIVNTNNGTSIDINQDSTAEVKGLNIDVAVVGAFDSYSIKSNATSSAGTAYSFYGSAGKIYNADQTLIGATALSGVGDFAVAQLFVSQGDTGASAANIFGIVGEACSITGSYVATGIAGIGLTASNRNAIGLSGEAKVNAATDTGIAYGIQAYSTGTHTGADNVAIYANAANASVGGVNYSFYGVSGHISNAGNIFLPTTGSKIDFFAGDITLTHSAGLLTLAGDGSAGFTITSGDLTISSGAITQTGGIVSFLTGGSAATITFKSGEATPGYLYTSQATAIACTHDFRGILTLGANASLIDYPNAKMISSNGNTSHTSTANITFVGEALNITGTDLFSIGVLGVAQTSSGGTANLRWAHGIKGVGKVNATSDVQYSIGVYGEAKDTHAASNNCAFYADATNSSSSMQAISFYGAAGRIISYCTLDNATWTDPIAAFDQVTTVTPTGTTTSQNHTGIKEIVNDVSIYTGEIGIQNRAGYFECNKTTGASLIAGTGYQNIYGVHGKATNTGASADGANVGLFKAYGGYFEAIGDQLGNDADNACYGVYGSCASATDINYAGYFIASNATLNTGVYSSGTQYSFYGAAGNLYNAGNIMLGTTVVPSNSATNTIKLATGTPPNALAADAIKIYSADGITTGAGSATLSLWVEASAIATGAGAMDPANYTARLHINVNGAEYLVACDPVA